MEGTLEEMIEKTEDHERSGGNKTASSRVPRQTDFPGISAKDKSSTK